MSKQDVKTAERVDVEQCKFSDIEKHGWFLADLLSARSVPVKKDALFYKQNPSYANNGAEGIHYFGPDSIVTPVEVSIHKPGEQMCVLKKAGKMPVRDWSDGGDDEQKPQAMSEELRKALPLIRYILKHCREKKLVKILERAMAELGLEVPDDGR